jgi:U3 small nucleolar RNA-associated protein 15
LVSAISIIDGKVFDLGSRAILRNLTGHTDAVRCARFLPSNTHLLSASDDKSVRIWDISTGQVVHNWEDAHDDYIRTAAVSRSNDHLVLTGSYDHTVKLWDLRANQSVMTLTHGSAGGQANPVESVLFLPGDAVVLSAGGNQLRAWDILGASSGRLLHLASNHQKTITSMCLDGSSSRVLTASLDRHVKIYNVSDYQVVHSVKYPAPVLSVAISVCFWLFYSSSFLSRMIHILSRA